MIWLRRIALLALNATIALCAQGPQASFHLRDGDRVVFYGDSITDQRLYTTFTETFVVTRFPGLKIAFVHSGWGGDRVTGGGGGPIDVRLQRDVLAYKPTVMTIMLGMNDGSYRAFDPKIFNTYATGYEYIIRSVKSALPGIRITVIQPSPFDDVTREPRFEGGYNAVLLRYGQFVKELAQGQGGLSWTQADRALPMPLDPKDTVLALAVRSSDFVEALNQQPLKVTGLTAAAYTIRIDGEAVGKSTSQQLAAGVNLATLPTPMVQQAMTVHALTLKHNNIHFARWRQVQVPLADDKLAHKQAALEALDQLDNDLVEQQRAAAQPKPRRYELIPD